MFGFNPVWFIGVVESRMDPLMSGRCKVRCLGFHQQDISELPTKDLPWSQLLIPPNSQNEIKPPKEGSWVLGFFKDGKRCQEPMIVSLIPGIPTVSPEERLKDGFYDKAEDKGERPFPPKELKYTKDHEWLSIDGDVATVGVTDFAQSELGDIVYVEVETLDETLEKEEVFGTV